MFTGIVEELAQIKSIKPKSKGIRYVISAEVVVDDLKIGDISPILDSSIIFSNAGAVLPKLNQFLHGSSGRNA